jgi:opacity protein-like surface antigen
MKKAFILVGVFFLTASLLYAQFPLKIRIGGNLGYYLPSLKTLNEKIITHLSPEERQMGVPKGKPIKGGLLFGGTAGCKLLDEFNVNLNVDFWRGKTSREYTTHDPTVNLNTAIKEELEVSLIPISLAVTYDLISLPMISVYAGGGVGVVFAEVEAFSLQKMVFRTPTLTTVTFEGKCPASGTGSFFQLIGGGEISPVPNFCLRSEIGYVLGKVPELKQKEITGSVTSNNPEIKRFLEKELEEMKKDKGKPVKYDSNDDGTADKILPLELDGLKIGISACLQF